MFKVIKSSIFLLGMLGASSLCLATDYNFRTNGPYADTEDSEDTTRTRRDEFYIWLRGALNAARRGAIQISMNGHGVPIQQFRATVLNDPNQVKAARFGGHGWNFGVNIPIPEGENYVWIGAHGEQVYQIERVRYGNERDRGFAPEKNRGDKDNFPNNPHRLVQ